MGRGLGRPASRRGGNATADPQRAEQLVSFARLVGQASTVLPKGVTGETGTDVKLRICSFLIAAT